MRLSGGEAEMMEKRIGDWRCVVALPPRNDTEAVVEESWHLSMPGGVDFEGQHFQLPEGCRVSAEVRWLEPALLHVRLSLNAPVVGRCARCLEPASLAISDELLYLYSLLGLELGKDTRLVSDEGFMPVEVEAFGRTLDLSDQVWESLLLLLPLKPLCKGDCSGLCPGCGADLNKGPCTCSGVEGDPRLEVLRRFSVEQDS